MGDLQPFSAPVAPNESIIRGKIIRVGQLPDNAGSTWDVMVKETESVDNQLNFTQSRVGKSLLIYVQPKLAARFNAGDFIEAHVFCQGDERGGDFFVKDDRVLLLKNWSDEGVPSSEL